MVNKNTLFNRSIIVITFLLLLFNSCSSTQGGKVSTTSKKKAEYGFPWKFEDLNENLQKKALKLGYNNSDMVYREAPMGKIIPAVNEPKVIVKKMTIMNNEVVYYGIINLKVVNPIETEKIRKLGYRVPEVWIRISSGGKKIVYISPSDVP